MPPPPHTHTQHTHTRFYPQGATTVKEELLDDIIKESGPYKPPGKLLSLLLDSGTNDIKVAFTILVDKIRMRAEMSSGTTSAEHGTESAIEPNE